MNDTVRFEPYGPVECDHCGKSINNVDDGIAIWNVNRGDGVMEGRMYFAHRRCEPDVQMAVFHLFHRTKRVPLRDLCLALLDV